MKVAVVFLAVLAVTSSEDTKEKRGAISYTTPKSYEDEAGGAQVAYATAKVSPQTFPQSQQQYQTVKYITPQQQAPVVYQQALDYQQAYQGQQQTITKLAPSKVAYASQQAAPIQTHYSLASDVSSFSYNSPIVKYSNQGVLSQTIGQLAQPEKQVEYAASTQQAAPQLQYTTQKVSYAPQPQKIAYTSAPQQQYTYVSAQQPQAQQPKYAYTSVPQKVSYVQAQQPQYQYTTKVAQSQPQAQQQVAYVSAGQKQQQAYQLIPQSQLQAYLAQAQQAQQPAQQQQQYVYQQVPQGYEKAYQAAQSNPQPAYVVPQQQQYYSLAAKAPAAGVAGVRYA